jgi:hypothetical protein
MKTYLLIIGLLAALALTACRRGEITSVERNPEGGVTVTARLTEADVNAAINEALEITGNPLLRNPQVDLQNGLIVVSGEHVRRDGNGTVSGSFNVTLTAQNGALLAQVSNLNIEGFDVADERLATFNQRLVNAFTNRANRENRQVTVDSVTITNDAIEITITARRA